MTSGLFIGLMSGTSLDGVDGVLIDLAPAGFLRIHAHAHQPYAPALREELLALNRPGQNELHRAALAGNAVAMAYAVVVESLLAQSATARETVTAIGAHGQTVRHRPLEFDGVGYTAQLLNGALLAERTRLPVICDFRSRDLAAGGQGAPLVPAFHHAAFAQPGRDIAVLNIGGIANLTLLPATGDVTGHDCGPGNVLLDLWCQRHTGQLLDHDGAWARQGRCDGKLLSALLQDGFVQRRPPKSTGRDHYNADWLDALLRSHPGALAVDVQCTLAHFTAQAVAHSLTDHWSPPEALLVCGGGALNSFLMDCLRAALPNTRVQTIHQVSKLDPMHVEAAAFAWLAQAHVQRQPGNLPAVTGAQSLRILGTRHPA